MRTRFRSQYTQVATIACAGLFLLCQSASRLSAATNAAGSPSPGTTTNAAIVEVPKSAFIIPSNTTQGRDPFFPLSRRLVMNAVPKDTNNFKPAPVTLALKGVSGTDSKRYALINDKTFVAGEEREISVGASRVRVHCLEIREDSVIVEVNGTRQELRLRPGL